VRASGVGRWAWERVANVAVVMMASASRASSSTSRTSAGGAVASARVVSHAGVARAVAVGVDARIHLVGETVSFASALL
jgi:hypothetical protein